jgi:RNA polymerase sigma-70 factor (sigma-E family)
LAWLLTGDRHRADELVQQTLVRTYIAWPRARTDDPMAYARRVMANARTDTWRKHRREVPLVDDDTSTDRAITSQEHHLTERDALVHALRQLSPRRRRVVVLRYLMDLSEREVADDLNVSVGTVKSTAARGLAELRTLLAQTGPATAPTATTHRGVQR